MRSGEYEEGVLMPSYLAHLPAGPFTYRTTAPQGEHDGKGSVHIKDASGRVIAAIYGKPDEKLAIAELLIDARDSQGETRK
jgi:hypothetical protein